MAAPQGSARHPACRTAALGGHRDRCEDCGHVAISYNSCGNRHWPRCQGNARLRWLQARVEELLPTRYVHAVFTLPRELAPVALQNKKIVFNLLFHAIAETLLAVARDPRHLGAEIGFFSLLHTWDQRLLFLPHAHCMSLPADWLPTMADGSLPPAASFCPSACSVASSAASSSPGSSLPFTPASSGSTAASQISTTAFRPWLRTLYRHQWVVYSKRPFGGPEHALRYLGAYTHRVAISNSRLVALEDGNVTFRWRDSAHGHRKRLMTLAAEEFLRRFLLHLLPRGFVRIRNFGFLANRRRAALLPLCRQLLQAPTEDTAIPPPPAARSTPLWRCPKCGGAMHFIERISSARLLLRAPPPAVECPA